MSDAWSDPALRSRMQVMLEERCAQVGRLMSHARADVPGGFLLLMFSFGEQGLLAYFADADLDDVRAAVQRWLDRTLTTTAIGPILLREIGDRLQKRCLPGTGFAFLVFLDDGHGDYVSNAHREDMRRTFGEWLEKTR